MNARIEAELKLLRLHYDQAEHIESDGLHWFHVQGVRTPDGWSPDVIAVAFSVTQGYPGAQPYGFFVPMALVLGGMPPSESSAQHQPPFPGVWRFLSWTLEDWRATDDIRTGGNLWAWVRSFPQRLKEGQ